MVEVGIYVTRKEAELARDALTAAGIPCVLAPDEAGCPFPADLSGGAQLFVAEADAHDAAEILRRHALR
jgi:Putative prokaryotic signal transducing protein